MKINKRKLNIMLARQQKSATDLRDYVSSTTLTKVMRGGNVTAKTVGRLAKALGCDPADIIEEE